MKKRLLSLALALSLCLGLTVPALAAHEPGIVGKPVIMSAGYYTVDMIDENDALWMWGANNDGQLGNGGAGSEYKNRYGQIYTIQAVPIKIMDNAAVVSCGQANTAAVKTDGSLWVWGNNVYGQIGNGTVGGVGKPQTTPVKVLDDVVAVCCRERTTAAVKKDGTLWMWGQNTGNAFNNGGKGNHTETFMDMTGVFQTVPFKIMDGVKAVYDDSGNTPLVLKTDGALVTWAENAGYTESSDDEWASWSVPIQPTEPLPLMTIAEDVVDVSTHGKDSFYDFEVTAYLKKDGTLWMYGGGNKFGELGSPAALDRQYVDREDAVQVEGLRGDITSFAVMDHSVAVVNASHALWGWGASSDPLMDVALPLLVKSSSTPRTRKESSGYTATSMCILEPTILLMEGVKVHTPASAQTEAPDDFTDVPADSPFKDAIAWAVEKKITTGTSKTTFGPSNPCTQNHIQTFLWRANGSPAATGKTTLRKRRRGPSPRV